MKYIEQLLDIGTELIDGSEKYFCIIRKSFVPATPEEKVRQNFIKYLIDRQGFPIDRIKVEESLSHYKKGNRRIDILVLDQHNQPFIIYECKKQYEPLTDDVLDQALDYFNKLPTVDYLGIVIGDNLDLVMYQNDETTPFIYVEQPNYKTLISGGKISVLELVQEDYQRNEWRKPIDKEVVDELMNYGIIGEDTDVRFHSFLINLDGWLLDQKDKLSFDQNIEDIGIKNTKFGNAGGGFFAKEFRSFLLKEKENKPIVCIALTAMASGRISPIGTALMVGIETTNNKNVSLELRIGKSIKIKDNKIIIIHNGTITVGKIGASKKQDLLDFIEERKPSLIMNGDVYLGEFDENEEINSKNVGQFIKNLIDYALLRNEFREIRKQAVANKV